MKNSIASLLLLAFLPVASFAQKNKTPKPVVIAYVGGYRGLADTSYIDVTKLTHINYAFVDVKDNRAWLHFEKTDTVNFKNLNLLKRKNPSLKILISIGGWAWSKNFSDASLTDTGRRAFAASAVNIIRQYALDGVDIDWEYPGMRGNDGNVYRPEDKENYTLLFRDLRHALDSVGKETKKKYLLTTATGGFSNYLSHTDMKAASAYLDYVNLMTYDYSWGMSGHHTNLYNSDSVANQNSADKAIIVYIQAGVPVQKMVMGVAFYGRGYITPTADRHGFNQKPVSNVKGGGYSYIKDSVLTQPGNTAYWDDKAKAPYIFNETTKTFITYDDERSVKYKCQYVKEHKMAGVMFWEYSNDPKGYLLNAITEAFK